MRRCRACCSERGRAYALSLLAYLLVCFWLWHAMVGHSGTVVCPSRLVYHLPCPGCGTTRACVELLHGHVTRAIMMNPNCLLATAFVVLYPTMLLGDALTRKPRLWQFYRWAETAAGARKWLISLLLLELVIWIKNIVCGV